MRIIEIRALRGPNVYHNKPVLTMKLGLENLTEVASNEIPGFNDRLVAALPGLHEHRCSPGKPGGFLERLERGTYFAHIVEHVALELSTPVGIEVGYGKSIYAGAEGQYLVVIRYKSEEAMKEVLRTAVELTDAIAHERDYDLSTRLAKIRRLVEDSQLGPSAQTLIDAAEKRSIPWRRIGDGSLIQFGYGKYRRRTQTAVTDLTSLIATDLVQDKELTKTILREASIPVAAGITAGDESEVRELLSNLNAPYVVKPIDGHHGNGVTLGLSTLDDVIGACREAWKYSSRVIIEEQVKGSDFRILVVGGKFVAAALRTPAHVVGDGEHSVTELIEIANRDPQRGSGHSNALTKLELDEGAVACLMSQGFSGDSVLAAGQRALLKRTANLSTGGSAKDVTDETHVSVRDLCERIARVVGLDICGVDLMHSDITKPVDSMTAVIEVNAGPGLRMHVMPSEGRPRDVGGAVLDMLYPNGMPSRIPVVSVTGTNGKTTIARLIAHIASLKVKVGLTTSSGIYIDSVCVEAGDTTGPRSARLVLDDPGVEFAVLETARGGMMRSGLGYDWSDVGVVSNIRPDHFGQDGIETIEDLVRVKSLVVERVKHDGVVILNADDEQASRIFEAAGLDRKERKVVYYSMDSKHPLLMRSLRDSGFAFCIHDGWITEISEADMIKIARVSELAFTLDGTARFNVSNALAAAAAARGAGIPRDQIAEGLRTFLSNLHNYGRSNLYKVGAGYLMLDYGHNPDAIRAIGEMVKEWRLPRTTAVIGLPGDRSDALLAEGARAIADSFDRIVLRDDVDLRGRASGETPALISRIIVERTPRKPLDIVLDEKAAITHALTSMKEGELIVAFYDEFDLAMSAVRDFDPIPIDVMPAYQRPTEETRSHAESPTSAPRL